MNESKGLKILIGVLLVCVISLSGYIVYYKFFDKSNVTNQVDNNKENNNQDDKKDEVVNTEKDEDKDKLLQCETSLDGKKYKYYVVSKYEEYILKITNDKGNIVYTSKIYDTFDGWNDYNSDQMTCDDFKLSMTKLNSSDKDNLYLMMELNESGPGDVYYVKDNYFIRMFDLNESIFSDRNLSEFYKKNTNEKINSIRVQNGDLYFIIIADNSVIEYKYVFKDGNYSREKISTDAYTYDRDMYPNI